MRSIPAWLPGMVACLAFAAPLKAEHPKDSHPVTVGGEGPELDACVAVGRVTGLDPEGDNYLAVRARPHLSGHENDRLDPATLVWLCDKDGDWQGIVYPHGAYQDLGDCRVSSPVTAPEPYGGPCRQGWVLAKYLDLVAG